MKAAKLFFILLCLAALAAPAAAAGGAGTAANPYIIQTAAELQSIQNNLAAYYKLGNDINLQGVSFIPIGSTSSPFTGSFDGAGYTISNLVISSSELSTGFFSCLSSGATVKNTIFQDCSVTCTGGWCGVVIGSIIMSSSAHETAVISNVDCVRCSVSATLDFVGCLVGFIFTSANVEITDCDVSYSKSECTNSYNAGCLVGQCNGQSSTEITRCNVLYSLSRASSYNAGCLVGGITYESSLLIDLSTAQNSIVESHHNIGCLVGQCTGQSSVNALNCDVVNCLAKGTNFVSGLYGVNSGGSVAASDCTVTSCTIVATGNYAGGIAGNVVSGATGVFNSNTITGCTILATSYAATICPAFS